MVCTDDATVVLSGLRGTLVAMVLYPLRREPVLRALGRADDRCGGHVHVAVMREPWLKLVLDGQKTIESRFSRTPVAPHGVVQAGDLVLFKRPAGPLCGTGKISGVEFHELRDGTAEELRARHSRDLCADDAFWLERSNARYVTLMMLTQVREIPEIYVNKRDRRGWVVLDEGPHVYADQLPLVGVVSPSISVSRELIDHPLAIPPHAAQLVIPGCGSR